jgi:Ca2+-binding RTX toxin-like protein
MALPLTPRRLTDGNDTFNGTAGDDWVQGLLGNDTIFGRDGNDFLEGDGGNDTLRGEGGLDTLNGGLGDDILDGGAGSDTAIFWREKVGVWVDLNITGRQNTRVGMDTLISIENLVGSDYEDSLFGNNSSNTIKGGLGNDYIEGDGALVNNVGGSDFLWGQAGDDTVYGWFGNDTILGGIGNDLLDGDGGNDTVSYEDISAGGVTVDLGINFGNQAGTQTQDTGAGGVDILRDFENATGSNQNDTLIGNSQSNALIGRIGSDKINGKTGRDFLQGDAGSDTFLFAPGDSGQTSSTIDVINDLAKGALGVGDLIDYATNLTIGGSSAAATGSQASINQTTGVASFASGSGATLADCLSDIASRFTAANNASGEFALFQIVGAFDRSFYMFISDGVAGVGPNDVVAQLSGVTSVAGINLASGNLTITA